MLHPDGGFFSSQDADSEGVEGKFFAWSYDELVQVAGEAVATAFGARPSGNWEGTNVLWRPHPIEGVAEELGIEPDRPERDVQAARGPLLRNRAPRGPPPTRADTLPPAA